MPQTGAKKDRFVIIHEADDGIFFYDYFDDRESAKRYADWKTIPDFYIVDRENVKENLTEILADRIDAYGFNPSKVDLEKPQSWKEILPQKYVERLMDLRNKLLGVGILPR